MRLEALIWTCSAGNIKTSKDEIIIRSNNRKTSTKGVENIVVYSENNGDILRLKDIAKVEIKFSETPIERLCQWTKQQLYHKKTPEEDIKKIANEVQDYIKKFNNEKIQILK